MHPEEIEAEAVDDMGAQLIQGSGSIIMGSSVPYQKKRTPPLLSILPKIVPVAGVRFPLSHVSACVTPGLGVDPVSGNSWYRHSVIPIRMFSGVWSVISYVLLLIRRLLTGLGRLILKPVWRIVADGASLSSSFPSQPGDHDGDPLPDKGDAAGGVMFI